MTKTFYSIFIFFFSTTFTVFAQPTTSSPYSKFGLGDLVSPSLPQNKAMGGISVGLRKLGSYSSINVANPSSYSSIDLTTFDMGAGASFRQLDASSAYNNNVNMNLSHIVFGVPVSKKSAISFGLLPYSEMGYQYKNSSTLVNTTDNTSTSIDYIYGGDGGLSKVYMGYGILLSPHLSVGVNAAYLFGNLKQSKSTEFPQDTKALNSRQEASSGISGLSMDYGVQYIINTLSKSKLTIGYAGTISDKFTAAGSTKSSVYRKNFSSGDESISLGTPYNLDDTSSELSMPIMQTIGFAFEKANKFLVGADFSYAQWSNFRWGAINPGLNDSYTVVVGGQVTPNVNAISGYFKLVDYRFGLKYNKTFVNINNTSIDQYAVTLGLGLPLAANRLAFYKINFSAEIGIRGRLDNGLVRENYVNLGLGFTINDKWFIKPKFD